MGRRINSKQKGKRGELELCQWLRENWGALARRSQQYKGTADSADVDFPEMPLHFECKRTESLSVYKALDQAAADCGDKLPVVAHRRSRRDWVFILNASDVLRLADVITKWKDRTDDTDFDSD